MSHALMIDIETLSLRPDAFVTQVGYVVADLDTGKQFLPPTNLWLTDDQTGDKDMDTIRWWMTQEKAVAKTVFDAKTRTTPDGVFSVFKGLVDHLPGLTVWGSPAMFDLPILTSMWGGRKPWKYNMERDMMTLYKELDPHGLLKPPPNNMAHDAASDAAWQMDYLLALRRKLAAMDAAYSATRTV